jgi:hypothetical protein
MTKKLTNAMPASPTAQSGSNHAAMPALCAECLTVAHALAETGPPNDRVIKLCAHAGPDLAVIAVGAKIGGEIKNWHLEGPLTEEQAHVVGTRIMMQFAAAGMFHHPITKQ